MQTDLIFLHPPSVYDFRKTPIMYGPVSDVVPSTPIFEMYPFGLPTIGEYLERNGISVRIINVAVRMLKSPDFDAEKLIASLKPKAFGIDLHWLLHAQGGLEIAKLAKKCHPNIPLIFGGFSATYYHQELISYPQVDFVMRGDSTEQPMLEFMEALKTGTGFEPIPNLTWKDPQGKVHINPLTYVPDNVDHVALDCTYNIRSVFRYRDLVGHIPFDNWLEYPITPAVTCRGCNLNCIMCGGSAYTFKNFLGRDKTAFRDPELLAHDMSRIQRYIKGPIFVIGDIRQAGREYADRLLDALKRKQITNQVCFEFFWPPDEELFVKIKEALPHFSIEMSIETPDEEIRKTFGKNFTNGAAEAAIGYALKHGVERIDIYFMTGLPKQTKEAVLKTADYCRYLYEKFQGDKRILVFIAPMAPFLDPGSIAFENPEKYGYRLLYKTLEEHRQALMQPSWKYILNYETKWMNRSELVDATYETASRLNRLKAEYGVVSKKTASEVEARIAAARGEIAVIDKIMVIEDKSLREKKLLELKAQMDKVSESTVCDKRELEWPTHLLNFRIFPILRLLLNPWRKPSLGMGEESD